MANVLILRFSAIGDVAMTVPVIDSLARQRSGNSYTVVSQDFLKPLFDGCPDNVRFIGINLKTDYRGIAGMFRLYGHLSQFRFDMVADLHDVLRTKLLRFLFRCSGLKVRHIRKGRKEKRRLTARRNKQFRPLKSSTERYADVFRALGLPAEVRFRSVFASGKGDFSRIEAFTGVKSGKWTGIAPFAKHQGKIYPIDRTERIIAHFSQKGDTTLFLFGGGSREKEILEKWSVLYPHTVSVAGKLKMSEELILISHLDVMLSMDSANMHLASLTATPVVSVWGATHPHAGFYGYRQLPQNAVQLSLSCRPCSVYGNKPCYRKDVACLTEIEPQTIIGQINRVAEADGTETAPAFIASFDAPEAAQVYVKSCAGICQKLRGFASKVAQVFVKSSAGLCQKLRRFSLQPCVPLRRKRDAGCGCLQ